MLRRLFGRKQSDPQATDDLTLRLLQGDWECSCCGSCLMTKALGLGGCVTASKGCVPRICQSRSTFARNWVAKGRA
jgi:hypothetical protein